VADPQARPGALHAYLTILRSRVRAQASYRTSFSTEVVGSAAIVLVEFAEVYLLFHNVPELDGLDFEATALVFALANLGFAFGDMLTGHLDEIPTYIRTGGLEALMVRPLPLLAQLVTGDLRLRRVGRAVLANSFTYGSEYAASFSAAVLPTPLRVLFTFVVPAAFTAYLPTLALLGLPGPTALPSWLGWFTPLVGLLAWLAALGIWRLGSATTREQGDDVTRETGDDVTRETGERTEDAAGEPVVVPESLVRDFVVHRRAGRLIRHRERLRAVDEMTFTLAAGESVGYIGANEAGKSTTIKMITGILTPTSGSVRTCGLRPVPQRRQPARQVGVVFGVVFGQRSLLWWDLPLEDSLRILAAIHRPPPTRWRPRRDELVERLDLGRLLATPVRQLSLGEPMRGELAAALLLTTHDMDDVQRLCDRVLVVDHGRLVYDGDLPGLAGRVGARRVLVVDLTLPTPPLDGVVGTQLLGVEAGGLRQRLAFEPGSTTAAAVLARISESAEVRDLTRRGAGHRGCGPPALPHIWLVTLTSRTSDAHGSLTAHAACGCSRGCSA
jgi:ABC-2 type transport system ATP-binding protein